MLLVDDNISKALKQIDERHAAALSAFDAWSSASTSQTPSLAGHQYFELAPEPFRLAATEFRQTPYARASD